MHAVVVALPDYLDLDLHLNIQSSSAVHLKWASVLVPANHGSL